MADRNLDIALRIKADLESARKQLDELNKSVKATGDNSKASGDLLDAAAQRIDEMESEAANLNKTLGQTEKVATAAGTGTNKLGREVAQLASNLAHGNIEGAVGNITNLGKASGATAESAGLLVGTGGAVVAVLALLAAGSFKGYQETERLRVSVIATGGAAGVSATDFSRQAEAIGAATDQYGKARQGIEALAASGRVAGAGLGGLGKQAVDMSTVTGESVDQAVAKIIEIGERPSAAIAKLNEQYHFLTSAQYAQIAAMEAEGDVRGAARLANQLDAAAMADRAEDVRNNAGLLERAANTVKAAWDGAWDSIKGIGRARGLGDQAQALESQIDALTKPHVDKAGNLVQGQFSEQVAELRKQLADIRQQQWDEGVAAANKSLDAQANVDAIAAQQRLSQFAKPADKRDSALKAAAADRAAALYGVVDPAERVRIEAEFDTQVKTIQNAYTAAVKKLAGPSDAAAQRAAQVAHQALLKMIGDEQGALDPTAKIWATYNNAVTKANDLAEKAKTAKNANVVAINAERDAVVAAAAQARDAGLDKAADKARAAFDKLRDSLKGVDGVSLGNVRAQIAQLNEDLKHNVITPDEYQSTVELALNQGVKKLPTYRGVDAEVAGPFGELDKLDIQQKKLQDAYAADLDLLNQQHAAKLRSDESFVARENLLFAEHAANLQRIDEARVQVMLQGISGAFAQGAAAIKQGLGEQSNAYKAAFALQKAAAIAMAIVNMQLDISQASAKGWPANVGLIAKAVAEGMTILGNIRSTKLASGGSINGPGTGTSDSVPIWASNGEFMQRAAAVRYYGVDFMHAVNNMSLPRYATGGPIGPMSSVPRLSAPSPISTPSGGGGLVVSPVSVVVYGGSERSDGSGQPKAEQSTGTDGSQLLEIFLNAAAGEAAPGGKIFKVLDRSVVLTKKGQSYG